MMEQNSRAYFVTGIGTDVGKTVTAAIIAQALSAHYWKPIQSGDLTNSDSLKIRNWTTDVTILEEKYRLSQPLSPHTSARLDGVKISSEINLPEVDGPLIVEGAGGIMVPINDDGEMVLDLIQSLNIPVIVVIRHYLGSINHSLLTIQRLQQENIPIAGLVVSGDAHPESEAIILKATGLSVQAYIEQTELVNAQFIQAEAVRLKDKLKKWLLG